MQQGAPAVMIEAESFTASQGEFQVAELPDGNIVVKDLESGDWLGFEVNVPVPGRYRCEIRLSSESNSAGSCWIEDYYDNKDGRTYNITAGIQVPATRKGGVYSIVSKDGSPLDSGLHKMKFHPESDKVNLDWIKFTLMKHHQFTPDTLVQNMEGSEWKLVWADEFEGQGLPDTSKWTFDIGNWGWGNNEPQFYTEYRIENARQENGHLIIEARKNDMGQPWTSARLTTRGKISFIYGKIEFRGRVPSGDGTWAAGWLLGDAYRDEISWPYCGEIDVLECVGREIDDQTGDGINHASCHTRAYYFKQGNQITSIIPVQNMTDEFHIYSIEWYPDGIHAFVDGEKYFTYDQLDGEWEWPFNDPQNLIVNLAMGGGMGGEIDKNMTSAQFVLDYVRVYAKE
ncbi:MAG: glycosyl hydrolase family protein [Calditrichaeota bacterium]|nr:family 16 glycosylhydrolase [Calditrichota bacterium]RQV98929.1 MAG: glycosyl hydrolase family protein [Calditrichota bacterium]